MDLGDGRPAFPDDVVRPSPALSVALCTLNGAATVADQLEALLAQQTDRPFEIIVVDNGSTDNTAELVGAFAERDPRVRLVSAPERQNLSYARNVGAEAAEAPFIAFCDDDDLVHSGWVDGLLRSLEQSPFVASSLEYQKLNDPNRMVGRAEFQSETIGEMFGLPVANGAIAIARTIWLELGGNDENFGTTGEDFDFAMRVFEERGIRPIIAHDAIYHYRLREGARGAFRQWVRYGESHVQLYQRHGRGRVDVGANSKGALRDWWWILTRAPIAAVGQRRQNWSTHAGRRVGRVIGSIKHRSLWL